MNNTVYQVAAANGRGLYVGDSAFSGPFAISNNLLVVRGANQLALRGPGGFGGTASMNVTFGGSSGSGLGTVGTPDLTLVQSTDFNALGFLRPAAGGTLVDGGDPAWSAIDSFYGAPRGAQPDVGAFEAPVTAARLTDGFKP